MKDVFFVDPFAELHGWWRAAPILLSFGIALFALSRMSSSPAGAPATSRPKQTQLEFLSTLGKARTQIDQWEATKAGDVTDARWLRRVVSYDYLFILGYAPLLALLASALNRQVLRLFPAFLELAPLGALVVWLQLLAGCLDVAENCFLLALLNRSFFAAWPPLAYACAAVKFALVGLGVSWIVSLVAITLWLRARPGS